MAPDMNTAIVNIIRQDSAATSELIAKLLKISKRTVLRRLEELKKQGTIRRIGPTKGGKWELLT